MILETNTIRRARNKLKRLKRFLLPREKTKGIIKEAFYFPWQLNDRRIFCQVPSSVGFSISKALTIMVLYQFCCPNKIHKYFGLLLSFLEMAIPSLSQPFCPYIPKQTQFAAMVEWVNSQKSIVVFLVVCTFTSRIQFHLVGLATAEESGGNHIAWMGSGGRQFRLKS